MLYKDGEKNLNNMDNNDISINQIAIEYIVHISEICKEKRPLVAIQCITYNHEPYLRDTLEGFVMQQTNFQFVAIVHEDASTDGTAEVLREFAEKYPDIIFPIFENENQYSKKDGSLDMIMNRAIEATGAKYIAICEGDDYWIDPLKLQKQVDFLESNPDYGMCYTRVIRIDQENKNNAIVWGGPNTKFEELLYEFHAPTLTTLYRKDLWKAYFNAVQPETKNWRIGDYPLGLFVSLHSKIHFIDEISAIYRVLPESASHSKSIDKLIPYLQSIYDVKYYFVEKFHKDEERYAIEYSHLVKLVSYLHFADDNYKDICLNQLKKCKHKLSLFKFCVFKYRIKYKNVNLIYLISQSLKNSRRKLTDFCGKL